mgnify:CR=1 FL=1
MIKDKNEGNKILWKYASMATQFFVAIALGVFAGIKLDEWIQISFPLFVWLLPLLMILGMIIKVLTDTNKK